MKELYFVTGNKNKVREVGQILGIELKSFNIELDEIQSLNLEEIAYKKAEAAYQLLKKPLIAEDAGLFIEALNGFPGPFVKHVLEAGGNQLILKMLQGETNRTATAKAVFAFHDGQKIHTYLGEVVGRIGLVEKGQGWGWDPIFIPIGGEETYAELGPEKKNLVSHRRTALEKFKKSSQFLRILT